jgi:tetratricopeptide (TPR) repeat protein
MRNFLMISFFFLCYFRAAAQQAAADSLSLLLAAERTDTGRVTLMWKISRAMSLYNTEKALDFSNRAYLLAQRIKYTEGLSRSLGAQVVALMKIGNYPRALEYIFKKLQIEEKRNLPGAYASTLVTIGNVYNYQEDYDQARNYYLRSDSVNRLYKLEENQYFTFINLGDVYDKLNQLDSAFYYYNRSMERAILSGNHVFIGASLTGLGHIYFKKADFPLAQANYHAALLNLQTGGDDELLCEATLGLANLFLNTQQSDSAVFYATAVSVTAQQGGFMSWELKAAKFLADQYEKRGQLDSAYAYLSKVQELNDTLNSKSRIKESQVISSNEILRQQEAEEARKVAQKERDQQLQYLLIGIFIPGFFLITLLLSRIRIPVRVIKILGILSLLMLFEFLTLLMHPYVAGLTHHTPVYELLIFVTVAALLIPGHHRIEKWLIKKLTRRNEGSIRFKKVKMKMKGPSE